MKIKADPQVRHHYPSFSRIFCLDRNLLKLKFLRLVQNYDFWDQKDFETSDVFVFNENLTVNLDICFLKLFLVHWNVLKL